MLMRNECIADAALLPSTVDIGSIMDVAQVQKLGWNFLIANIPILCKILYPPRCDFWNQRGSRQ